MSDDHAIHLHVIICLRNVISATFQCLRIMIISVVSCLAFKVAKHRVAERDTSFLSLQNDCWRQWSWNLCDLVWFSFCHSAAPITRDAGARLLRRKCANYCAIILVIIMLSGKYFAKAWGNIITDARGNQLPCAENNLTRFCTIYIYKYIMLPNVTNITTLQATYEA